VNQNLPAAGRSAARTSPMPATRAGAPRSQRGAALLWLILVVVGLGVGGFFLWQRRSNEVKPETTLSWVASKEKMRVSVVESGQLKAAKSVDIYCEVKGGATILELVDEGTKVQGGDTLVRLDASNLEDELTAQKIKKLNAEAALTAAEKTVEIQKSKNQSDIDKAALDMALAKTDYDKYLDGDYPLKKSQAESDILLAQSTEQIAVDKAKDTRDLVELDFAAETEAKSDELAAKQATEKRKMVQKSSEMLDKYERPRQLQVLESAMNQTRDELERVKLRCDADLAQKAADYESKKATFDLEKGKLEDLEEQVTKTLIVAPSEGLVVYPVNQNGMGGRGGSDRDRIEEGATAREHQLLLSLPDTSSMVVVVSVHESAIDKLKLGQPAVITIDARPDLSFIGSVTFIAPLPDSQNQWLNPDLKVYRCEIQLAGDTKDLRPGMSASVEIVIDELNDAIAVPIHAVNRRGDHYFVYVQDSAGKPAIAEVKVGLHNDNRVAITDGVQAGDRIYLAMPPGAPQPDFPVTAAEASATSVEELRKKAGEIPVKATRNERRPEGRPDGRTGGPAGPGGGPGQISQADMEKWQKMTPEERKKAMEDLRAKMTPEERAKWDERAKKMREAGGAGGGDHARPSGSAGSN
jgi:RND family efflux transporter MFP subunit